MIDTVNELLVALKYIADSLDADDEESYRADDPEGAMDSAFSIAKRAIAKAEGAQ